MSDSTGYLTVTGPGGSNTTRKAAISTQPKSGADADADTRANGHADADLTPGPVAGCNITKPYRWSYSSLMSTGSPPVGRELGR
jgi:hypothetical protein